MIFKVPRRDRKIFDAHAERCIFALSPHEAAQRRVPEGRRKPGPLASNGVRLHDGIRQRADSLEVADFLAAVPFQAGMPEGCRRTFRRAGAQ